MSQSKSQKMRVELRAGLLASTALVLCLSHVASAATIDGGGGASAGISDPIGPTEIFNFSAINSAISNGITASHIIGSSTNIHNNGNITGIFDGIYVFETFGTLPVTIDSNGVIAGNGLAQGIGLGIDATTLTGPISVTNNAGVTSAADDAIWAKTFGGNITVDGNGAINGNDAAVLLTTVNGGATTGDITVTNNASLTGNNVVGSGVFGPTGAVATWAATGTTLIQNNGPITGGASGVASIATTGNITVDSNGHILGQGTLQAFGLGVDATTTTGSITITNNAGIESLHDDGVWAHTLTGNIAVNTNQDIIGSDTAVLATTGGAGTVDVKNNGALTGNNAIPFGDVNGAVSVFAADGAVTVQNNGAITGGLDGVDIKTTNGNVLVDGNGHIKGQGLVQNFGIGVEVQTVGSGNITVTNNSGIESAHDDGVWAYTLSGNIAVNSNQNVAGNDAAILAQVLGGGAGNVDIQGNGNLTGNNAFSSIGISNAAVTATAGTGDINIGTTATNGLISGAIDGIYTSTGGTTAIVVDKDVTGAGHDGMWINNGLTSTGNTIDIAAGTTVAGKTSTGTLLAATAGIAVTTGGTMDITNRGVITTLADTGAADLQGGTALWSSLGDIAVNNEAGAYIVGGLQIGAATSKFDLNNKAGATWIPNSDPVGAQLNVVGTTGATDAAGSTNIHNEGVINTRQGLTYLAAGGIGANMVNMSGGVIDMTYLNTNKSDAAGNLYAPGAVNPLGATPGTQRFIGDSAGPGSNSATDSLFVRDLKTDAGSKVVYNVDYTASHNTGVEHFGGAVLDSSTANGGKGTADTIVFGGIFTPVATSVVDLKMVGGAAVGSSGSIALITPYGQNASGKMLDPGLGGYGTIIASTNYTFASDPSTGAVVYRLVDDPLLGLYLQWAPNLSANSLGAWGGAIGDAASASPGSAIGSSSGSMSGVGGSGLSGGPSGGGAAGHVADAAAGNALQADDITQPTGGSLKDGVAPVAVCARSHNAWAVGEASRSNYKGGADGRAESLSGGLEAGLGDIEGRGCNRVAVGAFGFAGSSDTNSALSRDDSSNEGLGAYIRASSAAGFYATVLGAYNWSDHDLFNGVFGSTANKDASGWVGVATLGYVTRVAPGAALDFRTFASYGKIDGAAFTDSVGITVSGTDDKVLTVGGLVGLHAALTANAQAFVRGGVKWAELDSSITAYNITQSGSVDEVSGSVEAGLVLSAGHGVQLGFSGFGEFSDSADSYGGRGSLKVDF